MINSAKYQAALVTISDRASQGEREDKSGKLLKELVEDRGYEVVDYQVIPDELPQIKNHILWLVDLRGIPLVLTTGGTGISPRDITPEATRAVIEKELPGFSEAMRAAGRVNTSLADISRAVCGIRGQSLIINFPGSPKGVRDGFKAICQAIDHVLGILSGKIIECGVNEQVGT
jgi:molybdenum cofactor synthesis domain-containing protein